jgi:hypothetical protein
MTTSSESLERKIESVVARLVREHLSAVETASTAAVREGFRRGTQSRRSRSATGRDGERARGGGASQRRSREVVAKLEEQLYQAICAQPGETMRVFARAVGSTPRALNRPATLLRLSGRVRSVGQRQYTRYFPMGESSPRVQAAARREG